ncbi:MAG: RHS repeat-associated core domain-containing protein [Minicystis sp.]
MRRIVALWLAGAILAVAPQAAQAAGVSLSQGKAYISDRMTWSANASPQVEPSATSAIPSAGEGGTGLRNLTPSGSLVVTTSMGWIGNALDYGVTPGVPGSGAPVGALPSLEIRRYHNYRGITWPSSFGQGSFSGYDISLSLYRTSAGTGAGAMILFDPRDTAPRNLADASGSGLYLETDQNSIAGVRLYDAASQPVVDQAAAATAVLTTRDGWIYTFEIIRTDTTPSTANRLGRLVRIADRNGNAIVLAYEHPAGATDAQLGFDRQNLWKVATVTDAYGRTATFTYAAAKKAGRFVVSDIALPDGQALHYSYQNNALVGLSGVSHPDGSVSTLSATPDAQTQALVLHVDDAAAVATDRRRDVYLTNPVWIDPTAQVSYPQPANLARMIVNGAGEVVYAIQSAQSLTTYTNTYHVYEGGSSFFRYTTDLWGAPVQMDQAQGWDITLDPAGYSYQLVERYATQGRRVTGTTDILGRATAYSRDPVTGAVQRKTYPDGSFEVATYDAFRQPRLVIDRLGRKTRYTYDARGNLLSKTAGAETPAQATWSYTYDTRGQVVTATDANGNVKAYAYTPEGYLASVTDPPDTPGGPQAVTSYAHDAAGRLTSMTDPRGRVTRYQYDARNRVTGITHNDGSVEATVWGSGPDANLPVQKVDRVGNVTRYGYDAAGRETQRTSAFGKPEAVSRSCVYLSGTNLTSDCTDRGERTSFTHDDYNRRVSTAVQPSTATLLAEGTAFDTARRVHATTDPYGRRTFYLHDINDRVIREVQEMVPGALTPPASQAQREAYLLGLPRVLSGNAAYLVIEAAYDAAGQVLSYTDGRGVTATFAYDGQGRQIRQIEAAGTPAQARTEYDYDPQGNLVQVRHPRHFSEPGGFITAYTYTGRNLPASITEALGRPEQASERHGYDLDEKPILRIDGRGHAWSTVWSQRRGDHLAEVHPAADLDGDASTPPTSAVHAGVRDSLGRVTHAFVASDAAAFPNEVSFGDPAATLREVTTRYDGLGRPVARTVWMVELGDVDENAPPIAGDPGYPASAGLTTSWTYDDDLTDGVGLDASYGSYLAGLGFGPGSDGSAVEETNPAGEKTVTISDGLGRVVRTVDVLGGVATSVVADTVYDTLVSGTPGAPGTLLETRSIAHPGGLGGASIVTAIRTDGAGREVASVDGEGWISLTKYDANGNQTSTRDPNGVGEDCVFDARNRPLACTDTAGDTAQRAYDANDNAVSWIDGLGRATVAAYDGRDRCVATVDRLGGVTTHAYDANGNPILLTDADARSTTFGYDARNAMIGQTFPDGGTRAYGFDAAGRQIARMDQALARTRYVYDRADRVVQRAYPDGLDDTFAYDAASRLTAATSARYQNTVARAYDAAGRQIQETLTVFGQDYVTDYDHDAAGRTTAIHYPDGSVIARTFTARDQLDTIAYNGDLVVHRTYDPGMRLTATAYGNGAIEARTYTADDLVSSIAVPGITGFAYSYDADENPLAQANSVDPGDDQGYAYDSEDRLTSFTRSSGDAQSWSLSLTGDWNQHTANGVTESRAHGAAHQLVDRDGQPLSYDAKGNLVGDDRGRTYTWDFEDQMQSVDTGLVQPAQYGYDALGRRVSKTVPHGIRIVTLVQTVFAYDGWRVIAEYDGGKSAAAPTQSYVFGDALDEVLFMDTGSPYFVHSSRMLSVQAITDASGALVEAWRYDPYGAATVLTGAGPDGVWFTADDWLDVTSQVGMPFAYTGQRLDEETGLYHYKNRYYSAALGRFLSRDPLGYEAGLANLYQYVESRPVAASDPLGMASYVPSKSLARMPNGRGKDIDGDGKPNRRDDDMDGDGTPNDEDVDVDGNGRVDDRDSRPNDKDYDMNGGGRVNGTKSHSDPPVAGASIAWSKKFHLRSKNSKRLRHMLKKGFQFKNQKGHTCRD